MDQKKHSNYSLLLFTLANILTGLSFGITTVVLPLFAQELNATAGEQGIIKGISGIGILLMVLPAGFLVDYYGFKKLYLVGVVLSALTYVAIAFTSSIEGIILAMAAQGFGTTFRMTSLNAAFFNKLNDMGLNKSGWYRGAMMIGANFIGPLLGGYAASATISNQTIFLFTAIISVIPLLIILPFDFRIKEGNKIEVNKIEVNKIEENKKGINVQGSSRLKQQVLEFRKLLYDQSMRKTIMAEGIVTGCITAYSTFIVVYVIHVLGISKQASSWFILAEGAPYMAMVFAGGGFIYLISTRKRYLWSIIAIIVGSILVATHIVLLVCLGSALLGASVGLISITTYANLSDINAQKGIVSSVLAACTGLGGSLGPMYAGVFGDLWGYEAAFLSSIPILIFLLYYLLKKNKKVFTTQVEAVSGVCQES
jgi:MFS family permease